MHNSDFIILLYIDTFDLLYYMINVYNNSKKVCDISIKL